MRNLKKILALVLALVMSLSLMATAGATDFTDDADITDIYKESVDVLDGLKVFQGYPGGDFQPQGEIKRSEVAVIIYRIATGDIEGNQVGIYKDYNKFSDVTSSHWAAGYINYCANAEYIKGRSAKVFDPEGRVTGYEALAMILRAIGYDKNGEFTGSDWKVQTAATARQRGVIRNISEGLLGQAATREMVAEILCQTILVDEVAYTPAFGYQIQEGKTLAYDTFKMEKITGVVTANEYADLYGDTTLAANQTKLGDYTLNLKTTLDDIGESRYVYVVPSSGTTRYDLVTSSVYGKDANKTWESDKAEGSLSGAGMTINATTEHYRNFGPGTNWTSDWRIRYEVSITLTDAAGNAITSANTSDEINRAIQTIGASFTLPEYVPTAVSSNYVTDSMGGGYAWTGAAANVLVYSRAFTIGEDITIPHQGNISTIFNIADRFATGYIRGQVYVGTTSMTDVSDEISLNQFKSTYIHEDDMDDISGNEYGNWLKVIDNDNDNVADYVLHTRYTWAQVASVTEAGAVTLDVMPTAVTWSDADALNIISTSTPVVCDDGDLAAGDVVYYAYIDGKAQTYIPEMITTKFDRIDRNAHTATAVEDNTLYNEGGVHNHIQNPDFASGVANLSGTYTYNVYLTRGGHLGVFNHNPISTWTLLTDGWYNTQRGGIEYAVKAYNRDSGLQVDTTVTTGGSLFIGQFGSLNNAWGSMKALGGTANGAGAGALNDAAAARDEVMTTVAFLSADGALVPVDRVYNRAESSSRDVRMVALNNDTIPNTAAAYAGVAYVTDLGASTAYNNGTSAGAPVNVELRALSTTQYYYVYRNVSGDYTVQTYTGYGSAPSVAAQYVEDVYAVATRTNRSSTLASGTASDPYFTADVVVVELKHNWAQRGEQIFIYDVPTAGTSITQDDILYIDSNGELKTAVVDLTHSKIRNYLSGYGKAIDPGLYYMYPTEREGIYTIDSMSWDEIRDNGYVFGRSLTEDGITWNNYVEVETWTRTPADGAVVTQDGRNPEYALNANSGIYRLSYTGGAANASVVQNYVANIQQCAAGSTSAELTRYLGERVDISTTTPAAVALYDHSPYDAHGCDVWWNHNYLMIATSGSGIRYAISFANLNGTARNFARTVWNAEVGNEGTPAVSGTSVTSFYNLNKTTVTYAEAAAATDAANQTIVVTANKDATIQEVTVTKRSDGTVLNGVVAAGKKSAVVTVGPAVAAGEIYDVQILSVTNGTAQIDRVTLTQSPAGSAGRLTTKAGTPSTIFVTETTRTITVGDKKMSINQFKSYFSPEDVEWHFFNASGVELTDHADGDMDNVDSIKAIVRGEDGSVKVYTYGTLPASEYKTLTIYQDSATINVYYTKDASGAYSNQVTAKAWPTTSPGDATYDILDGATVYLVNVNTYKGSFAVDGDAVSTVSAVDGTLPGSTTDSSYTNESIVKVDAAKRVTFVRDRTGEINANGVGVLDADKAFVRLPSGVGTSSGTVTMTTKNSTLNSSFEVDILVRVGYAPITSGADAIAPGSAGEWTVTAEKKAGTPVTTLDGYKYVTWTLKYNTLVNWVYCVIEDDNLTLDSEALDFDATNVTVTPTTTGNDTTVKLTGSTSSTSQAWVDSGLYGSSAVAASDVTFYSYNGLDYIPAVLKGMYKSWNMRAYNPAYSALYPSQTGSGQPYEGNYYSRSGIATASLSNMSVAIQAGTTVTVVLTPVADDSTVVTASAVTITIDASGLTVG